MSIVLGKGLFMGAKSAKLKKLECDWFICIIS